MWNHFSLKYSFLFLLVLHLFLPLAININDFLIRVEDFIWIPLLFYIGFNMSLNWLKFFTVTYADKFLFFLFFLFLISTYFSAHFSNSLNSFNDFSRCLFVYIIFRILLVNKIFTTQSSLRYLFLLGILLLCIGFIQYVTNSDFGYFLKYFGDSKDGAYVSEDDFLRIKGTVKNTNIFGQWLVLLVAPWSVLKTMYSKTIHYKIIYGIIGLVCFLVIMATVSRGVFLFVALAYFAIFFYSLNKLQKFGLIFFSIPLLVLLIIYIGPENIGFINNFLERKLVNEGDDQRAKYIEYGVQILFRPKIIFLGTGLNALFPALSEYGVFTGAYKDWLDHTEITDAIHNAFLKILVETGIFGMTAFTLFYFCILKYALQITKKLKGNYSIIFISIAMGLFIPFNVYNSTIAFSVWFVVLLIVAIEIDLYTKVIRQK